MSTLRSSGRLMCFWLFYSVLGAEEAKAQAQRTLVSTSGSDDNTVKLTSTVPQE